MKKHMSFQAKLMLTYSLFLLFLLLVLGVSFYQYNAYIFQKNAETNLRQLVSKTSSQLDNFIREMDDIAIEFISDRDANRGDNVVEIDNVEIYLSLMKRRFESRLEYTIDVDPAILNIQVPKLTIQPLIENSISHGFENAPGIMKIMIHGSLEGKNWYIRITDNGSGFEPDTLERLNAKIEQYTRSLNANQNQPELSIGGMGLISTFARLQMLYGQELTFTIKNNETGGAFIEIGGTAVKNSEQEGDFHVQGHDR